jgi:hypothetical protein
MAQILRATLNQLRRDSGIPCESASRAFSIRCAEGIFESDPSAWEADMLDTQTKDMEPVPGWRFPRFLRFGDDGDETARPKATKPPKEPEERNPEVRCSERWRTIDDIAQGNVTCRRFAA